MISAQKPMPIHSIAFLQSNWLKIFWYGSQSKQSTRLFHLSSKSGPPPLTRRRSVSPPLGGGGGTLACGRGGSQFGRGDRHCGTLGICVPTLWYVPLLSVFGRLSLPGWLGRMFSLAWGRVISSSPPSSSGAALH